MLSLLCEEDLLTFLPENDQPVPNDARQNLSQFTCVNACFDTMVGAQKSIQYTKKNSLLGNKLKCAKTAEVTRNNFSSTVKQEAHQEMI